MDIAKDRAEALSLGWKYYYGNECNHCSTTIKRVRQYDCYECHLADIKRYQKTPKGLAYKKTYRRLYKANLREAKVPWADMKKVAEIYERARELGHHVDHIIPLKHDLVCGLHNEFNLQILPPHENIAKSNLFEIQ